MTRSRISELSSIITANTSKLDAFLESHGQPSLSFDADLLPDLQASHDFISAQSAAIEACTELLDLIRGSFLLIASLTSEVRRILRGAMATRVFREQKPGLVGHTAASKMLAANQLMRQWVGMVAGELLPASSRVVDAMVKWPGSEQPTHSGYNYAHNTDEPCFKHMALTPGRLERFGDAMTYFSFDTGYSPKWLVDHGPWNFININSEKTQLIVDVGGSQGTYSIPIAQKFKNIQCIIQDLPGANDPSQIALSSQLSDRISFQTHNFFTEQPVKADFYLLRWILHDWSDEYAIRILQALIPALKPGARVVIHEYILPEPGKMRNSEERILRVFDMQMRALMNGKEREAQEWIALFHRADPRFKVEKIFTPLGSRLGIIDVVWDAE